MESTLERDELTLLNSRQAAAQLGIGLFTLRRLIAEGTLKPVRLRPGGHPRFRLGDLHALAADTKEDDDA